VPWEAPGVGRVFRSVEPEVESSIESLCITIAPDRCGEADR